jgi:biopolymer transport protein ExbB/TolQ
VILSLLLDGLVAGLLVVTIVLALILNRRFTSLRRDRLEFSTLAEAFHSAVARAEAGVALLKAQAAGLEEENRQAGRHEDDLHQLIERADAAADRLEAAIRGARPKIAAGQHASQAAEAHGKPATGEGVSTDSGAHARSAVERDLIQALRFKR